MNIGILSDTHGFFDPKIADYFSDCDEIWHAGDIGNHETAKQLEAMKPFRAVYGNIDGGILRQLYPLQLAFTIEGVKICMIHIGGYPGKYAKGVKAWLEKEKPDIFICGHSHILKVMPDRKLKLLHINPGAAGKQGFHQVRTLILLEIGSGKILGCKVVELGKRV
ncbi:MAG: metallophosphoesterase family protein [Cyclobacteriaceae bacterium]|nr:metallophosphoesterase family protein [Cyclobacteriaceae bacterium]